MNTMRLLTRAGQAGVIFAGLLAAGAAQADGLVAARLADSSGPLADPAGAYWAKATAAAVELLPQTAATPANAEPAVTAMSVKAVHNGQWLAFLLEWKDDTKDDRLMVSQFGDQVAVELPVKFDKENPPNPMMGSPEGMVTIMQWRAAFQRDLDQGDPTLKDLYPFSHTDLYPDQVLRATDAASYGGARGLDNPLSHAHMSPVLDQMAKGFGSLTVKPEQVAAGKGVWKDGMWHVVITRPMTSAGDVDPQLSPGSETVVAFAAWNGGKREVGSRKSWSDWVPVTLEK